MIIVSKATKRHCAGAVQSQGGRVGNVKQMGFEPGCHLPYGITQCYLPPDSRLNHNQSRVSITPGNLLEFKNAPGNLLEFNWSSWKFLYKMSKIDRIGFQS